MIRLRLPSPTVVVCVLTIGLVIWHAVAFAEKPAVTAKKSEPKPAPSVNKPSVNTTAHAPPSAPTAPANSNASPTPAPAHEVLDLKTSPDVVAAGSSVEGTANTEAKTVDPLEMAPPTAVPTPAPSSATPAAPPTLDDLPAPLAAEAVEEILRLRRAIMASGTSDGAKRATGLAPDDQFRQALLSLTGQTNSLPLVAPTTPPNERSADPTAAPTETRIAAPTVEPPAHKAAPPAELEVVEVKPERYPQVLSPLDRDAGSTNPTTDETGDFLLVATLRDASRMLDNRAHDYDAERRFDEAEQLRKLAQRLRKDVRRIETTALHREAAQAAGSHRSAAAADFDTSSR